MVGKVSHKSQKHLKKSVKQSLSDSLCLANIISFIGTLFTVAGVYFWLPELLLLGRIVAAIGSGLSFGSLILFIQVIAKRIRMQIQ
jgi:hypothetical protein